VNHYVLQKKTYERNEVNPYPTNVENRVSSQYCKKIADWQMGCFC